MTRIIQVVTLLALLGPAASAQAHTFERLKITEVSLSQPEGVELTNFDTTAVDLTGWTVLWEDLSLKTSQPLSGLLEPGHSLIVTEANPAPIPEAPPGTTILPLLPALNSSGLPVSVGLRRPDLFVYDEVHVGDLWGNNNHPGFGGAWRGGLALRPAQLPHGSVERIWGLDSNSGHDWTGETVRSFGLENQSAGPRGTEPSPSYEVKITEVDDSPEFLELYNQASSTVNLQGWQLLITSGGVESLFAPFPNTFNVSSFGYVVLGSTLVAPSEKPAGVPYVNVASLGGPGLPLSGDECEIALYDQHGRLADLVRLTGGDDTVVHNHPRAPSAWDDFTGAAMRLSSIGDGSVGRRWTPLTQGIFHLDSDSGADWRPCFSRSMGLTNGTWFSTQGLGDELDVRANETGAGNGMAIIINAGPSAAGRKYSFLFSTGHLFGAGPFFGLGWDALDNWLVIQASPPFSGLLGSRGQARIDLFPGSLPPGIALDTMFILQDTTGQVVRRTSILMFDT